MHYLNIGCFTIAADVVHLTRLAYVESQCNRRAVVLYMEPVANLQSIAVNRQRLAEQDVDNGQAELVSQRKMIGPVVIGAVGDRGMEAICFMIGTHQVIRSSLARGIGRVGCVGAVFMKRRVVSA